ncbi:SulP family inorganic anion transporter [Rubrivivax rivuli]|uniref:STAS domain-containing protein n=1 Tax=Rubrivivax rivuli TaxID=1862385 RepID=A0A437RHX6_9BURK|nr:SulP family inorganic anion transporter [Rubrivivax rivuli]RVU46373.1 STAS domain-containing protein [Rubrivivax rivuli]
MLPAQLHPFRPRLLDALKGYNRQRFAIDAGAGLTVGIVALPLALAFGIASGVKPEQGLITAIVAGFLISALGGSQVQIGGPAGAFIVIVYGIIERYGFTNLLISTALAGVLMFVLGWFKLGALIRYIPVSIVIGFTNGIAVLIALSQLRDLLGLDIEKMPGEFFAQLGTLHAHIGSLNPHALAIGLACVAGLALWPRLFKPGQLLPASALGYRPLRIAGRMPAPIVALVTLTALVWWLKLPLETIGSRFGELPRGLPQFELPPISWASAQQLVIPTITIALLGAIESLLCARVADSMADAKNPFKRHDPNQELMAQGVANVVVPFFGGIPATGTIARTVTNVRAGATSPIAGIVHALTLLLILLVAAPLASLVPLAALAGILLFVAWNMFEGHQFLRLRQFSGGYRLLMVGTFVLTIVFDLTVAVQVGLVLSCVFFIWRMGTLFSVKPHLPAGGSTLPEGVQAFELYGSLFFGAVAKIEALPEQLPPGTRVVVLDMQRLVLMDSTGLDAMEQMHRTLQRQGTALVLANVNEQPLSLIRRAGFEAAIGADHIVPSVAAALGPSQAP